METAVVLIVFAVAVTAGVVYYIVSKRRKSHAGNGVQAPAAEPVTDAPAAPETAEPVHEPEPAPDPDPDPEPEPEADYDGLTRKYLDRFSPVVEVRDGGAVYRHLRDLLREACSQFSGECTGINLMPAVYKDYNFPNVMDYYGDKGSEEKAFDTLAGWLFALLLAELLPRKRTQLFKTGYEMGGYDMYSDVYGYQFRYDPNNLRILAAAIYAAVGGSWTDRDAMRKELGGTRYGKTLSELAAGERTDVGEKDFFIDLREFMPNAPGPYAPKYKERPDDTYPGEKKDKYGNLNRDHSIYDMVVKNYNLGDQHYNQSTVQAIADKEADVHHLFGDNMTAGEYRFHPVFGTDTIGVRIDPEGATSRLAEASQAASNSARGILQSASTKPKLYGRLRPGCSWEKECAKHSEKDDRYNALCCFEIEDNDGCPTGYYDRSGKWVHPKKIDSPEKFNEYFQRHLYANSYPSGHSSGIMGAALALVELMPERADDILRAANAFACGRVITRYHWQSDVINGKVLGTAQFAVSHAASDYGRMLEEARAEVRA